MTPDVIAMVPNVPSLVPGRGEYSSGPRASMATVQHQEPRQQIPWTDLALCSEAFKESLAWFKVLVAKTFDFWFGVKAALLEKPGRIFHFSFLIPAHTKLITANKTPDNCSDIEGMHIYVFQLSDKQHHMYLKWLFYMTNFYFVCCKVHTNANSGQPASHSKPTTVKWSTSLLKGQIV